MACAASPSSATGPSCQVGTGSRSIIGFSNAMSACRIRAGTSSQSQIQFSKWWTKSLGVDLAEPAALLPALGVVHRDLRDPVDHREAGLRVGMGDRIEDHPVAMRAEADEGSAGAYRLCPGRAAPHDRAAPVDRRLRRVHLRPDRRVDAVRADEQRAVASAGRAVGMLDERADAAVRILPVAGHPVPEPDRLRADPLHELAVEQHVKLAAMTAYCGHWYPARRPRGSA